MDEDEVEKASSEKKVSPDSQPSEGNKTTRPPLSGSKVTLPETVLGQIRDLGLHSQTIFDPFTHHDTAPVTSMGNFATQESVERTKQEAFQHSDQQYEALSGNYDSLRQNVESLNDDLDKMREKLAGVKKSSEKMDELEKRISSFEGRSIEVVGLLSSVVALVLVSASTANSQRDSLSAYLIIVSIAAALMLFACLLHAFFQPQSNRSFWKYWLPFALLPGFVIVVAGVLAYANSIVKR